MIRSALIILVAALGCSCLAEYTPDPEFKLNGNAEKGKEPYTLYCLACHGEKGDGNGPTGQLLQPKPANYTDPERMKGLTDHWLYVAVKEGAAGMAPGKSPLMTPWKGILSDQQIRDVVAYIKTFKNKSVAK